MRRLGNEQENAGMTLAMRHTTLAAVFTKQPMEAKNGSRSIRGYRRPSFAVESGLICA